MKKFVTLSAVALAGATLGVGSTFGWWAEDPDPAKKTVPADAREIPELKVELNLPKDATTAQPANQLEIIGDLQIHHPQYPTLPRFESKLDQLANELEREAKQLDDEGKSEAAKEKRKLSRRLRESKTATPVPTAVAPPPPIPVGPHNAEISGHTNEVPGVAQLRTLSVPPAVRYTTAVPTETGISRTDADRLTQELVKEADELEKKGQKEAAEIHRKLISRLQRTPRRTTLAPAPSNSVNVVPTHPVLGIPGFPSHYTPATPAPNVVDGLPTPRIEYRDVTRLDPLAVSVGQRATQLEHEAKQLDEKGQADAANGKRKLAGQLREIEKQFPTHTVKVAVYQYPPGIPGFSTAVPSANVPVAPIDAKNETRVTALIKDLEEEAKMLEESGRKSDAESKRSLAGRLRETLQGKAGPLLEATVTRSHPYLKGDVTYFEAGPPVRLSRAKQADREESPKSRETERDEESESGASISIPKGMRVVSISAEVLGGEDKINIPLKPDSRVAVSVVYQSKRHDEGKRREELKLVLGDVRIFATQAKREEDEDRPVTESMPVSVALLVTQEQAQALSVAKSIGPLRLSLPKPASETAFGSLADFHEWARHAQSAKYIKIRRELPLPEKMIDLPRLQKKVAILFPECEVDLITAPTMVIVQGRVRDQEEGQNIVQIVRGALLNSHTEAGEYGTAAKKEARSSVGRHSEEIHGMLKALHHEITELRSEVRDLRRVIKDESRDDKRDPDARKERKQEDGERKEKPLGDQDDRPKADETKKLADPPKDVPQTY